MGVTSSTTKRTERSSLSSPLLHWSPFKNTLVSSSLDTVLWYSLVPPRLRADDQDPLEDGKEDRWSQGREPTGTFSIRKRRSRIRTHCPSFVEPFAKCAALGRFAVMDSNRLKMLGKVSSVSH